MRRFGRTRLLLAASLAGVACGLAGAQDLGADGLFGMGPGGGPLAAAAPARPAASPELPKKTLFDDLERAKVAAWVPAHVDPEVTPVEGRPTVYDVRFDVPGRRGDGLALLAELGEARKARKAEGDTSVLSGDELLRALRAASTLARQQFAEEPLNVVVRLDTGYRPETPDRIGEATVLNWDVFLGRRPGEVAFERDFTGKVHTTLRLAQTITDGMWGELGLGRMAGGQLHPPTFLPGAQGPGGARGALRLRYTTRVVQGPESVTGSFTFGIWPYKPDPEKSVLRLGVGVEGRAKPKSGRTFFKSTALAIASDTVMDEVPRSFQGMWRELVRNDKLALVKQEPLRLYTRKAYHEDYRAPDPSRKYGRSRERERDRQRRHQRSGPTIYTTEVVNGGGRSSGGNLYVDLRHTQEKFLGKSQEAGLLAPQVDDFWIHEGSVGLGFAWVSAGGSGAAE